MIPPTVLDEGGATRRSVYALRQPSGSSLLKNHTVAQRAEFFTQAGAFQLTVEPFA